MHEVKQKFKAPLSRLLEQRWFDLGLRGKMGILVAVGVIGLIATFALLGISTASQVTNQVLSERVMLARQGAAGLDAILHQARDFLVALSRQQPVRDPQAETAQIQAALETGSFFDHGIFLLDTQGQVVAAAQGARVDQAPADWGAVPAVSACLQGEPFSLSPPAAQPDQGIVSTLVAAVPVYSSRGELRGVLAALTDMRSSPLFASDRPVSLGTTGRLDVVDASGRVLISTRPELIARETAGDSLVLSLFVAGEPGIETCLGCSNAETTEIGDEVIAFAPLSSAPWGVVVRQKAAEVFSPVRRLTAVTLSLGLAAFLGAAVLVWLTTNSVIHPVQALTQEVLRMAEGDFTSRDTRLLEEYSSTRPRDEIGTLAKSFITMREQLKQSMDEIQALNRDLDARVHERTEAAIRSEREAQAVRDDLRAVINALTDQLIVIGVDDRKVKQMNLAAERDTAGGARALGQSCFDVCHCNVFGVEDGCNCPVDMVLERNEAVQVTHLHKGAKGKQYIDIIASPLRDANGKITRVVELSRDVTEDRELRGSLVRRNQQLSIVNAVSRTVNQSLDLQEILDRALNEILNLTGIDAGAVFLLEEALGNLKLVAYQGLSQDAARVASEMGMLDGACGGVINTGQILVVPDLTSYRGHRARSLKKDNLKTLVHIPLTAKGSILGSMCVGTHQRRQFSPEEQELLNAIGSQIAVSIENARLYAEVQHKEHVRGELYRKAINAQEDERKRIARELHDDTSQALTALLFSAEEVLDSDDLHKVHNRLEGMHELIRRTLDGVHKVIFDLRPSMLDHLGLVPALRWFANSRLEPKGVRVTIEENCPGMRLPPEIETVLFRVVQEAVLNIARHAAARNVGILFQNNEENMTVTVEDDGIGFDINGLSLHPDNPRGLGLVGMQERIELVGGDLEVETTPGLGTRIVLNVPLAVKKGES